MSDRPSRRELPSFYLQDLCEGEFWTAEFEGHDESGDRAYYLITVSIEPTASPEDGGRPEPAERFLVEVACSEIAGDRGSAAGEAGLKDRLVALALAGGTNTDYRRPGAP